MANEIPMEEIRELWNGMPNKSWEGLKETQTEEITDTRPSDIIHVAEEMESRNEPFPSNPDELYQILNNQ